MKKRLIPLALSLLFWLAGFLSPPVALASIPIQLTELVAKDCPPEFSEGLASSGGGRQARCYLISGKAKNNSGKTLVDADIFGRIYDANGEPVFQNRGRVGTLVEVPPGTSDFEFRVSIAEDQPPPLQLKQFKAAGFTNRVRPFYYDDSDSEE